MESIKFLSNFSVASHPVRVLAASTAERAPLPGLNGLNALDGGEGGGEETPQQDRESLA